MEQTLVEELFFKLREVMDVVWDHAYRLHRDREEGLPNVNEFMRLLYFPEGSTYLLTRDESDRILESYDEMGIVPIDGNRFFVVFDEDHVIEHKGRRYVGGPVMVRSSLDSCREVNLSDEEIWEVSKRLEANAEEIRFGGIEIPALKLR